MKRFLEEGKTKGRKVGSTIRPRGANRMKREKVTTRSSASRLKISSIPLKQEVHMNSQKSGWVGKAQRSVRMFAGESGVGAFHWQSGTRRV